MTTEEKAKAYDEAIKKAKEIKEKIVYSHLSTESCKAVSEYIDTIIPELRESEDERMMREFNDWLCEEIECRTNDLRDEKDHRTLNMLCYILTKNKDWLEKQKKQKPDIEICPHSIKSKSYLEIGYPIEQKPAKKQDYSGLNDLERAIHRGFICAGVKNVPVTIIKETAQDCLAQIPDEISYGEYLQYGERQYARGYKDGADSVKPVEWSEEDEKFINELCGLLAAIAKDGYVGRYYAPDLANRLKSLRPHWKPSEEQMEALHTAVYLKEMEFYGGLKDKLRELYDDLLKLK